MDDVRQVADLEPKRHRLDVHAYHLMGDIGIFDEDSRVELIDGEVYDMAPPSSDHAGTVNAFTRALVIACGDRAVVSVQNPVRLDQFNEPQPDFSVLRPREDMYRGRHAGPSDILLLVEVSKSSLKFDRAVKLPLYARAGVGEVWVIDLVGRKVESFQNPANGVYETERIYEAEALVSLALAPEITFKLPSVLL